MLRRRLEQRPVLSSPKAPVARRIFIDRGNTLDTGQLGIKWASSQIDEVPSAYDPNSGTSFMDGIGRGQLEINGILQSGYVLVVNDTRSGFGHALLGENGEEDGPDKPWAFSQVFIAVAASSDFVPCWIVG